MPADIRRRLLPAAITFATFVTVPAAHAQGGTSGAAASAAAGSRYTLANHAAVFNLAGSMRVEATTGASIEVVVTRQGAESAKLGVETGDLRGRPTLRVIYPSDRIRWSGMGRNSSSTMSVSEDGTFSWKHDGGSRRVRVSGDDGMDAYADVVVRVPKGADVGVWLGVGNVTVKNVEGDISVDVSSADVTANGVRGKLSMDTGSGDVQVTDVQGSVNIDAGSGDFTVDNVRGDELVVDGGSGNVTGKNVKVRRAVFDLGSGDTQLSGVAAEELMVDTGSGSVDIGLVSSVREMTLDTGSGDVTLRVPATFGATLEVDTGSGDLDTDLPLTITRKSRTSLVGKLGDGSGRVRVDTGSGDVRILLSK